MVKITFTGNPAGMLKADIEDTRRLLHRPQQSKTLASLLDYCNSSKQADVGNLRLDQRSLCRKSDSGVNMEVRAPRQCKSSC